MDRPRLKIVDRTAARVPLLLVLLAILLGASTANAAGGVSYRLAVSYTGTDYYQPTNYFNHCGYWTWLTSCYTNSSSGPSAQSQVAQDAQFIAANGLGTFQRVWISLDQLMYWNNVTGYQSYHPDYLAHLDDALSRFARYGIKVDLVLFTRSQGTTARHQFRPKALDGLHPAMRTGYLRAVHDFLVHLSRNRVDASTIGMVDLENEAYLQLDEYFQKRAHLGGFTQCADQHGVSWHCLETRIIHPWLSDLYATAKATAPSFLYTVSSDGDLLTSDRLTQVALLRLYPVDVYDVHLYSNAPWKETARWASSRWFDKPWFSGETGCSVQSTSCIYDGERAAPIDRWWLRHMQAYGAQAILIEDAGTAWSYRAGPLHPGLTTTGRVIQQVTLAQSHR